VLTKQEIEKELIDRELSTRLLSSFTTYTKEDYEMIATQAWEKIHPKIIEKLEAVERWEIKRLMIFVRPRIWKSELASIRFPAWILWRNPKRKVVVSSYGADLASDFWRKTKQVVESVEFGNIFPSFKLAKDKREWGNWETSLWGWMYTVWVWWALTGKGFDIGIIDDPVKDRLEAESEITQQRIIDWYTSTFYTRRQNQDSAIILMMTRWSPNDLAGYLLEEAQNWWDQWEVLKIPAIDDQWNAIVWEWKWDKWYIEDEKSNVSPKDWAALYQQDPIASSSNIFDVHALKYFNLSDFEREDWILNKTDLDVSIFIDPAHSSSRSSDDAVIAAIWHHIISWDFYLLNWYADTSAPSKTYMALVAMIDMLQVEWFNITTITVEDVPLNNLQTQFIIWLKKYLASIWRYYVINTYKPKVKKEDRIKFVLEPVISMNKLVIRKDLPDDTFVKKLLVQLRDFPNSRKDDVLDCVSQWVEVKSKRSNPKKRNKAAVMKRDDYS